MTILDFICHFQQKSADFSALGGSVRPPKIAIFCYYQISIMSNKADF